MADMQSPQHPLEVLPAMLNLVVIHLVENCCQISCAHHQQLLQTAKILRDPECHNPKQAGLIKRRITEIVTVANQRFHDALDEIELEIVSSHSLLLSFAPLLHLLSSPISRSAPNPCKRSAGMSKLPRLTTSSVTCESSHGTRSPTDSKEAR